MSNKEKTINKGAELFAKCRHGNNLGARGFKLVRSVCNLKCKSVSAIGIIAQKSTDGRFNYQKIPFG